ncbi:MAG: DUF433 domain-containing protein [Gemmatimonadota bacterium]|nr:DUF433 domain-containing protein [Gemmatimonadota bacterium]
MTKDTPKDAQLNNVFWLTRATCSSFPRLLTPYYAKRSDANSPCVAPYDIACRGGYPRSLARCKHQGPPRSQPRINRVSLGTGHSTKFGSRPGSGYSGAWTIRNASRWEPDKRAGKPCIRGLRITVSDVLELLELPVR